MKTDAKIIVELYKNVNFKSIQNEVQVAALLMINSAIEETNNLRGPGKGRYLCYWVYLPSGEVSYEWTLRKDPEHLFPYKPAYSKQIIEEVVEKLGKDVFRIACGIPNPDQS